ncbi:MAG: 2Fe-2S iron-sulfur cluster-binding protein [Chloroflexi bacterium]|nr:2Fe-2S iron-sulfur cluster-binding protein [Chloroflexota bacterium]
MVELGTRVVTKREAGPVQITMTINGVEVKASEDMNILEAAREAGIDVPTLCYHKDLTPYGACRLCTVEITKGKRTRLVASCVYPAEEGLIVQTETETITRIRKTILEMMLARAPGVPVLRELGSRYGADSRRFDADHTFCILCGLCVRYCDEIKNAHAIGFVGRGEDLEVSFIPEIAAKECPDCGWECMSVCPTGVIPSNYALAAVPHFSYPKSLIR